MLQIQKRKKADAMSNKTADYTIKAIRKYEQSKDRITVLADKGTKDRIKAVASGSVTEYILDILYKQLEIDEKHQNKSE